MKVFISWSGEKSHAVAEVLRDWLPDVINAVEPWMSSEDIEKGAAGLPAIASQLRDCAFGIVCLTGENQERSWINYEAGALSKSVGDDHSRVATLLIDIDNPSDVTGPLSQFQATKLNKRDITRLVISLDRAAGTGRQEDRVTRLVEQLWTEFESRMAEALERIPASRTTKSPRTDRQLLEELVTMTRELVRDSQATQSISEADLQSAMRNIAPRERGRTGSGTGLRMVHGVGTGDLATTAAELSKSIRRLAKISPATTVLRAGAGPDGTFQFIVANHEGSADALVELFAPAVMVGVPFTILVNGGIWPG